MPAGILRRVDESADLRKALEPFAIAEEGEAERGTHAFDRPFAPFVPNAVFRELGDGVFNRAAERDGFGRGVKFEPGGKLKSAKDAQGVFDESGAGVTKNVLTEIALAVVEINDFVFARVEEERVDGEIAAGGGFFECEAGIEFDGETFVARSGFGIATG